jgi:hypothetical protein
LLLAPTARFASAVALAALLLPLATLLAVLFAPAALAVAVVLVT